MKHLRPFLLLLLPGFLVAWQAVPAPKQLDTPGLQAMLTGLGYVPRDLGNSLYEVKIDAGELSVPVRVFLSKSRLKLWLSSTVMLKAGVDALTREDLRRILERNVNIGPAHFMIEGGALKIKSPVDNRDLTPAALRVELTNLATRVVETRDIWQK